MAGGFGCRPCGSDHLFSLGSDDLGVWRTASAQRPICLRSGDSHRTSGTVHCRLTSGAIFDNDLDFAPTTRQIVALGIGAIPGDLFLVFANDLGFADDPLVQVRLDTSSGEVIDDTPTGKATVASPIPEPSALFLLSTALGFLLLKRKKAVQSMSVSLASRSWHSLE